MFKLLVLSALVAVAVAAPHHTASVWQVAHHETAVPVVYDAAEVVVAAHQPEFAHVGSVVDHYPSAVSHQSRTDYHSKPVVKSVLAPVEYVQPVVHQAPATTLVYSTPIVHQQIAHHQPLVYSSQPLLHSAGHQLVQAW